MNYDLIVGLIHLPHTRIMCWFFVRCGCCFRCVINYSMAASEILEKMQPICMKNALKYTHAKRYAYDVCLCLRLCVVVLIQLSQWNRNNKTFKTHSVCCRNIRLNVNSFIRFSFFSAHYQVPIRVGIFFRFVFFVLQILNNWTEKETIQLDWTERSRSNKQTNKPINERRIRQR